MILLTKELQAFQLIAKTRSVGKAATLLSLTQTAVTQRLQQLENGLGVNLFTRTRRGMTLTAAGEILLRYCHQTQQSSDETLAKLNGLGKTEPVEITLTGPTSIMTSRILPACLPVMTTYTFLKIHFDISDGEHLERRLQTDSAQLAIVPRASVMKEMASKNLKAEDYVLVCSAKWKGKALKEILTKESIIDYDPSDQLTFDYLRHYDLFTLANKHYNDPRNLDHVTRKNKRDRLPQTRGEKDVSKTQKMVVIREV